MTRILGALGLSALLALCSGCGTVVSLLNDELPSKVYGGVHMDALILSGRADEGGYLAAFGPCALVDWPLSLIMDTLLLPITLLMRNPSSPGRSETP